MSHFAPRKSHEVLFADQTPISPASAQITRAATCLQTYRQGLDLDAMLEAFLGGIVSPEPPQTHSTLTPEPGECCTSSSVANTINWHDLALGK
jgi:hypothetical protein